MQPEHDVFGHVRSIIEAGTAVQRLPKRRWPGASGVKPLPKTGGVLLSGDLYHYVQERTMDQCPELSTSARHRRGRRATSRRSLKRTGAKLWIQHDITAHNALKKAPAY